MWSKLPVFCLLIPQITSDDTWTKVGSQMENLEQRCISIKHFGRTRLLQNLDTFPQVETTEDFRQIADEPKFATLFDKNYWANSACGLQWVNRTELTYNLKTFLNREEAIQAGFQITHLGRCGGCSNLDQLKIYAEKELTTPVKVCSLKATWNIKVQKRCMKRLGFRDQCLKAWLWNINNTRIHCGKVCVKQMFKRFNSEAGHLNECLQCDEDKSGPQFLYMSGRTRRNSGLISEIGRYDHEIATGLDLCY